ncbi:hypothetical protein FKM82_015008 [Ascaphus truei]
MNGNIPAKPSVIFRNPKCVKNILALSRVKTINLESDHSDHFFCDEKVTINVVDFRCQTCQFLLPKSEFGCGSNSETFSVKGCISCRTECDIFDHLWFWIHWAHHAPPQCSFFGAQKGHP